MSNLKKLKQQYSHLSSYGVKENQKTLSYEKLNKTFGVEKKIGKSSVIYPGDEVSKHDADIDDRNDDFNEKG